MALEESVQRYSYEADGAIAQYILVAAKAGSPRTCMIAGAADALLLGSTLNKSTAAGQALAVAREGIIKVKAGGVVTAGAIVASGAGGKAVVGASGFGIAITGGNLDEVIEVQWAGKVGA